MIIDGWNRVRKNLLDLNTHGGNVSLLELTSYVTLDEGGLRRRGEKLADTFRKASQREKHERLDVEHTFPVPPSPTRTSLNVGTAAIVYEVLKRRGMSV